MKGKAKTEPSAMSLYLFKKKSAKIVLGIFLTGLIAGLCFTILYPVIQLVPTIFSDIEDLGNPNVIWLPLKSSTVSFQAALRFILPDGWFTMLKSILYAGSIVVIQIFFAAMAGYSLARVKFPGSKIVFFLVILVFLVPQQSLLLSQYIYFNHFNAFGLLKLFKIGRAHV